MSFQVAKEAALGFSRLKGIFRSGINYKSYSKIVATSSRPTIGNLPDDLLKLLFIYKNRKNTKSKRRICTKNSSSQTRFKRGEPISWTRGRSKSRGIYEILVWT